MWWSVASEELVGVRQRWRRWGAVVRPMRAEHSGKRIKSYVGWVSSEGSGKCGGQWCGRSICVGCKCSIRVGVGGVLLGSVLSLNVVPNPGAGFEIM